MKSSIEDNFNATMGTAIKSKYNVLILDDNEPDSELLKTYLERAHENFQNIFLVHEKASFRDALKKDCYDLIIADYQLDGYTAMEAIAIRDDIAPQVPLVIVSGMVGDEKAVNLIRQGASDFLLKDNADKRLAQIALRAIGEAKEKELRIHAEKELEENLLRYRTLFESSLDGILIATPDKVGKIIDANKTLCNLLGYTPDEMRQLRRKDFFESEKDGLQNLIKEREYGQKGIFKGELYLRKKDGEKVPVEVTSRIIEFKNGEERTYSVIRDISERKKFEYKLKRQAQLNNSIINSLPGLFFMISEDHKVVRVNDKFREILGYKDHEIAEMSPTDFVFKKDKRLAAISIDQAFDRVSVEVEIRLETEQGRVIPFLLSGVVNELEGKKYLLGTGIDIEERLQIEKELEKEKEFINKALDSLPGLFYMLDDENNFIRVNQNLIDEFGYSFEEIQNMKPLDFFEVDRYEEVTNAIERAFIEGEADLVTQMVKRNGDKPHYYLTGTRFANHGENYILGTGIDITEKKELESLLEEAHRLARIGAWEVNIRNDEVHWSPMTKKIHETETDYTPDLESAINYYEEGESRNRIEQVVDEAIQHGTPYDEELQIITEKGNKRWVRTIGNADFKNGVCVRLYGSFQDIHERKIIEEQLKESLKDKEILLMEIHHRVKNNLALVSGILQLQSFQTEDEDLKYQLSNSQSRIKSISIIHELLYQTENFSQINLKSNIKKLIEHISETFGGHTKINYHLILQEILVDVNLAIPSALTVNEVLTNIYKHAFQDHEEGNVEISLTEKDDKITLLISDDGVGLPENFDHEGCNSLGLKLIQTLKIQLNAEISFQTVGGKTVFELSFKKKSNTKGSGSYFIK